MGDEQVGGEATAATAEKEAPDFAKTVAETSKAFQEVGEEGGGAVGAALAEHLGVGESVGEAAGEHLLGPALGTAGVVVGAGVYAVQEVEHLGEAVYDAATEKGGTDPQGGTSLPGGVPADTTEVDAGTSGGTYAGEVDDPNFVTGTAPAGVIDVDTDADAGTDLGDIDAVSEGHTGGVDVETEAQPEIDDFAVNTESAATEAEVAVNTDLASPVGDFDEPPPEGVSVIAELEQE